MSGAAQEAADARGAAGKSADEVARELSNPNATLGQMGFPIDYIQYGGDLPGASDESAFRISFQPSLPVPLGPGFNFFARPLVSMIVRQPRENLSAPGGAQVIDADWRTLMPGPIDMHWHHRDEKRRCS